MKNILVVNGAYLPATKYGGPVTSIKNLSEIIYDEFNLFIVTLNHDLKTKDILPNIKPGWNKVGRVYVSYYKDSEICPKLIDKIVKEINPICIYMNSLFYARFTLSVLFSKSYKNIPIVLAPRGEVTLSTYHGNEMKKNIYIKFLKFFNKFKKVTFQATSIEERDAIISILKINEKNTVLLSNVHSDYNSNDLLKESKLPGTLKCIYVGRIHKKKNLLYALEMLSKTNGIDIQYDIYGLIEDNEYWEECLKIIEKLPSFVHVNYKGVLSHDEMLYAYSTTQLLLFPTKGENYGHSIVEALYNNIPVVIGNKTPWNDINEYKCGYSNDLNNFDEFVSYLQSVIMMDNVQYMDVVKRCNDYKIDHFDLKKIRKEYLDFFGSFERE